jgi:hypothetical protein
MQKCIFSLIALISLSLSGIAQSGIFVSSGTNLFIGSGATVALDSLVLQPSVNFNITGLNRQYRNNTVVHALGKPYVGRVFHFSTTTAAFSGAVRIYYRDSELNGLPETALTLNVHNGTAWNAYASNVIRNSTNNYVATTGLSSVRLNELTLAGSTTALLTMNKAVVESEEADAISVYPNPVLDVAMVRLSIVEGSRIVIRLYDSKGALLKIQQAVVLKGSNQIPFDMHGYAKGNYTIEVSGSNNTKTMMVTKQ